MSNETIGESKEDLLLAGLLRGVKEDPVRHIQNVRFATNLLLMESALRVRACCATIAILAEAGIHAKGVISTFHDYLSDTEMGQLREFLLNYVFFEEHVPEIAIQIRDHNYTPGLRALLA